MQDARWPYPGSRWWKFDFHTHTPASHDTPWYMQSLALSPEDWLLRYMAAEIDCVAITDHNTGAWIDKLKAAYASMHALAEQQPPAGFRPLTLFPGVEISVQGGVHLLALLAPEATQGDVDTLLGKVGYAGTKGDSDAETSQSLQLVIQAVLDAGAIPIPAHADRAKGLLRVNPGTRECALSATMVKQALGVKGLLAVEWCDPANPWPQTVQSESENLARVLGSDCHNFRAANAPGSAFSWVKMAKPTLEGLRLALLDGNGVSVRRSDDGAFDPFRVPTHVITSIEIEQARYMGNGQPARLLCSPFFNAVVGGRGTGKSTVVHALRLATRRDQELVALGQGNEAAAQFDAFRKAAVGRDDKGALRATTAITVQWQHEDATLRLAWRTDGQGTAVEELHNGSWKASASQSVNSTRFPLRIFSQGQIAALAGSGRQTLIGIIDEAARLDAQKQELAEATRTFFTQRSRMRELTGKLAGKAEVERKLAEVIKKLAALAQADNAAVLSAYATAQQQVRDVKAFLEQISGSAALAAKLPTEISFDEWPADHFKDQDAAILDWRRELEQQVEQIRIAILTQARSLASLVETAPKDARYVEWRTRTEAAGQAHTVLQQQLIQQGVNDPQAFARLTQERQQLEAQLKELQRMEGERQVLTVKLGEQQALLLQQRQAITQGRSTFIQQTLQGNDHVRIAVVPFGSDARQIEREIRELIDVLDDRFSDDILLIEDGEPTGGLAFGLARADEPLKTHALTNVKDCLLSNDPAVGGRLRNYLQRRNERPEFSDHVLAWFPEDFLNIEYKRGGVWTPISQGSQGQRSAALLAFLLAFGEEPIVLDQPEDDLDNHLIYDLVVKQIRENKLRRQFIVVTHNPNVVVNGDAELVYAMEFGGGQCFVQQTGSLQEAPVRREVCRVMEGGHEAFAKRWKRLGTSD